MLYSAPFLTIVQAFDDLMQDFPHTQKDTGYGYRWTFGNGHRVDLIQYSCKNQIILRLGRGAWFVREYPVLRGWFDEVMTVVAKARITDVGSLQTKNVRGILELVNQAPRGISVRM